ncbi:MAG: hypothetical protein AAF211_33485 [Myxococcota bacterium]
MLWMWMLAGCTSLETQEALFVQGAYFDWVGFNHRVSALRFGFADDEAELAIIGGTSTTGTPADLDDGCDPATCDEFPFDDDAEVRLGWAQLTTDTVALGTGTVTLEVPRGGASGSVDIELPAAPSGELTALLRGYTLDTDVPYTGEPGCYRPEYGWHPQNFRLAIDDVTRAGRTATVTVSAQFDPGPSFEEERLCIDEVFERAVIAMSVDVLVLAGADGVTDETVTASAEYSYGNGPFQPDPQEEVAPTPIAAGAPVIGWSSVDFAFDSGADGRGTYLRSFGFEITEAGATGIATNFSPVTQLTGMS